MHGRASRWCLDMAEEFESLERQERKAKAEAERKAKEDRRRGKKEG